MKASKKDIRAMEDSYRSTLNELYAEVNSLLPYLVQATTEKELRRKWDMDFYKELAQEYVVQKARELLDKKEAEYKIMQQVRDTLKFD